MWILPCTAYFLCFHTDFLTAVGTRCFLAYIAADDHKVKKKSALLLFRLYDVIEASLLYT